MNDHDPTRRAVARGIGLGFAGWATPILAQPAAKPGPEAPLPWHIISAVPTDAKLAPQEDAKKAALWLFDGAPAGPVLRIRHGEELRARLVNGTPAPLSLHWHGVRGPNAMDGVAELTQPAVAPGSSFDYSFTPPDPGTFLVRPLCPGRAGEASGRGLVGMLVVGEKDPPTVDADLACIVQDWKLAPDGALAPFGAGTEAASSGRLGGHLTVNGKPAPERVVLAPGSRVRLRLANACNARIMRVRFEGVKVYVAAIDGQPTDTFEPLRASLPLPPGTRYDLMLDLPTEAGAAGSVVALLGQGVSLVDFVAEGAPVKRAALPPIAAPAANAALPREIRLQSAVRRDVVIAGGATRGPNGEPVLAGDPAKIWSINGKPGSAAGAPLFSAKRGVPVVLAIKNQTPYPQPLHLHGHVFRLLHPADDGWEPYWLDTLQVPENRTLHIAFRADNPGRWAFSSTVLERFDTGLWTWFEIT